MKPLSTPRSSVLLVHFIVYSLGLSFPAATHPQVLDFFSWVSFHSARHFNPLFFPFLINFFFFARCVTFPVVGVIFDNGLVSLPLLFFFRGLCPFWGCVGGVGMVIGPGSPFPSLPRRGPRTSPSFPCFPFCRLAHCRLQKSARPSAEKPDASASSRPSPPPLPSREPS